MYNPQLETFVKVADAGSFSKAADAMYITPTAVIKQINLLENSLDLKLFNRTHRGLFLTAAGKSLYKDAVYMMRYSAEAVARARKAMETEGAVIRLGSSPMTPCQFLVDLWPKLYEYCPEIKFQIVPFANTPENAREILQNLGENIDIVAGVYDDAMLSRRKCSAQKLMDVPVCCAVPKLRPLAAKEKLTVSDLEGQHFFMIEEGWNKYVDAMRRDLESRHPEIIIENFAFFNMDVFNKCENTGSLLMATPMWTQAHPLLKVLPVEWDYKLPFGLLHSPSPSPQVQKLLDAAAMVIKN